MKKILIIFAIISSLNSFSQSFKDGNYKFTIDYLTDLVAKRELEGVKNVILHSTKNKITINSTGGVKTFTIKSKEMSQDGITTGDMEYRAIGDTDQADYLIIFKHRTANSYSINLSSGDNIWWEFHVTKITTF